MDLVRKNFEKLGNHAVVIGGSISGILAARILAEHFLAVTIIETDRLPEKPEPRRGVAQSVQPHVLFARGYRIIEELFPGISLELTAAGALTIDWAREFHHFINGDWSAIAHSPSDIVSITCSRPLLEWAIRKRLSHFSNVQFVKNRVTGLLLNNSNRVTGVRLQSVGEATAEELSATLVVDASGRRSRSPQWLKSLSFTPPPETVVNPFLGYATRRYQEPEGFEADWKVMLISHSPPNGTRLGYLARIEGGEWIATLGGYGRDFPATDNEGFLKFAQSLPSPKFYEAIVNAKPLSPIWAHRATANRLYHYEKVKLPQGFVALGDAVCALCPVYGQGMTVSALSAMILQNWLNYSQGQLDDKSLLSSSFHKSLAKSNSIPWAIATGQDLRFPTTEGKKRPSQLEGLLHWYSKRLFSKANFDPKLHLLLMEVSQLLKSPLALYNPKVVFRVLSR